MSYKKRARQQYMREYMKTYRTPYMRKYRKRKVSVDREKLEELKEKFPSAYELLLTKPEPKRKKKTDSTQTK